MSWIEIIAERKIQEAQEQGEFDNLPGKGQPLEIDDDPRVPRELRVVYKLLKDSEAAPEWIVADKEIRRREEQLQVRYTALRDRLTAAAARLMPGPVPAWAAPMDLQRDRFLIHAAETIFELNRMIDRFNLIVPIASKQRHRHRLEAEMETLAAGLPRLDTGRRDPETWREFVREAATPPIALTNHRPRIGMPGTSRRKGLR